MAANGDLEVSPMQKKDCFFFVQYGRCSYGQNCRYNHPPKEDSQVVQEGRTENLYANYRRKIQCKFYRAGFCKYGTYCEFNHSMPDPPHEYNSQGLPMRLGEHVCSFYMSNLWCGYGAGCKFHHPELQSAVADQVYASGQAQEYDDGVVDASGQAQEYDDGVVASTDGGYYPISHYPYNGN
ncbi:hypothetical protein L1987_68219 [Smallanthus sonchifolius]|uniref:Uncharacterized protein n=1 Tax=Smallanthus sonchifolius TaxID=185202 RepID=A0ACB9B5B5_9ASTR|nr:hypothetical protein L1987_68219 [Smallanthus sonchifolius]